MSECEGNAEEGFISLQENVPNFVVSDPACRASRHRASSTVPPWAQAEAGTVSSPSPENKSVSGTLLGALGQQLATQMDSHCGYHYV